MTNILNNNKWPRFQNKRLRHTATLAVSLLLTGTLLTVYFLVPVMGAAVDVLNGNGSMENSTQVGTWTLTNVTGTNSWALDTSTRYAGSGSGRLRSPTGNAVSYNGYVYYRFTTDKVPLSATLNVAYRKQYTNAQPSAGNWTVQAELWQVGGASALQTITLDTGNANVSWTNKTNLNVTAITTINTQYELRLVQKGRTGSNSSAYATTWFDSVQLNVDYDSTPPQVVSASAPNDHNVDVVFDEAVDQTSAQNIANYSISPGLSITGAALQPDGKTVRLTTAAQTYGTNYTVTANNVRDVSANAMTTPGTATFIGVDTTPPTVVSATSITDQIVNVKFSEPVDSTTAQNTANYSLSPSLAVTSAVLQADLQTVQLITATQTYGTSYTVTAANVNDAHGNVISGSNMATFTGIDTTPPTVSSVTPVTDKTLNVVFSEPVDSVTAQTTANYSIAPGLVVASAALQADQKTVLLTTTTSQTKGTSYTVTVTGVNDIHNNVISANNTAAFTGIDTTPPQVVSATAINDTTVNVLFNEQVDVTTAQTIANYSVAPGLAVSSAVLLADNKTVQLTIASQTWQTNYTVTVNNVQDTSANVISGSNTATFTGVDTTPPQVVSATPANSTTVDVKYNEAVDSSTAQTITNYVISPGLTVSGAVLQADGKTVRLTTAQQVYQTNYTVTVNGVKDLAGNTIGANNIAAFTGIESTPPTVVSAAAASYNTVNVVFSEKVDAATAQITANYSNSPSLAIRNASLQPDGVTVKLTTSAQTGGTNYTVTVTGVKDLAGNIIGTTNNTAIFAGISPPVSQKPRVLSASAPDNNSVEIQFNATMDLLTAQTASNYSIYPALGVTGAVLEGDGVTVKLTTATQTANIAYTVTVSNVENIYGNIVDSSYNTAAFTGSGLSTKNPHGNYVNDTDQCSKCHVTHNAQGISLINQPTQTQACYLCHDAGGQSQYDVADQFGKTAPYAASHHKIPEGTQQCSDCHNPHDGGRDGQGNSIHWPRLLQSSASPSTHSGNDFCFSCHQNAQGNTKAINFTTFPSAGVGHNNSAFIINGVTPFSPSSGTGISCNACHGEHGSSLAKLLKLNPNNDTTNVSGDDKTQCYECHTGASADNRYLGKSVYDNAAYNPHSLTSSTKTNASYPNVTGQAGQCTNCHDPHGSANGTSQVSMKTLRGVYNDGKTSYTAADFTFCFGCHNNTSANSKYDIQTPYNDSLGGHYIKTAGGSLAVGSKLPCEACHTLHGSGNNNKYLMKDSLGSNLGDGRNECLACHTTGKVVEGLTMSAPPSTVPEHTGTTTACLSCHGSSHAPNPGVSNGGVDCSTCHSSIVTPMSSTSSGYHHLMSNSNASYSTTQNGTRNCLSCHVDHNKFNNQKAYNLKANYTQSYTTNDTTPGQNSDFNSADAVYGGLCTSCHQSQQPKSYSQPDGTTATQPISISNYSNSAHNYTATSAFGDSTAFSANCVKCHNDDMIKDKQTSTNKFGTHNSGFTSLLSNFGDATQTNPMNEKFCYKCHNGSGTTDVYGQAMSTAAKGVYNSFNTTGNSNHNLTQVYCTNCHNEHNVSATTTSTTSRISDPTNTLNPFTTAVGDNSAFCIKCHTSNSASRPTATNTSTSYVPKSISFTDPGPNGFTNNGSGWYKDDFTKSAHYNASTKVQCTNCHDPHGSANPLLRKLPDDTATTDGDCFVCHNGTKAPNIKAEFQKTYKHPSLDASAGLHTVTENYNNLGTTDRHAKCEDCHDPHSADAGRTALSANTAVGATSITVADASVLTGTQISVGTASKFELMTIASKTGNTITFTTALSIAHTAGETVSEAAPTAPGVVKNVSGVQVGTRPAWTALPADSPTYTFTKSITKEYELCYKCHSSYSYGSTPPTVNGHLETDLAQQFNPNNPSYHPVEDKTKLNWSNLTVENFNTNSPFRKANVGNQKMYCFDCHGDDQLQADGYTGVVRGPHGSNNNYLLKKPYDKGTANAVKNDLCLLCHAASVYDATGTGNAGGTNFKNGTTNLHLKHRNDFYPSYAGGSGTWFCGDCHGLFVHGQQRKHLIVYQTDPAPYNQWSALIQWNDPNGGTYGESSCRVGTNPRTGTKCYNGH